MLKDPYHRFEPNSKRVGHAILVRDNSTMKAWQYPLPKDLSQEEVQTCRLENFQAIKRYGLTRFKAFDENGKVFYAKRFAHAHVTAEDDDEQSIDVALFSEGEEEKEPFWGSSTQIPRFKTDFNEQEKQDVLKELAEIPLIVKCGDELTIEGDSVKHRNENPKRNPDQNTVMGESARDHFENTHSMMHDVLSRELSNLMVQCYTAWLGHKRRPEWLHGYGYGLTPLSQNPQTKDNLGAAPAWVNTMMMVLERVAKQFAMLNDSDDKYQIKIHPLFIMFLDTEIIDRLLFHVEIETRFDEVKKDELRDEIGKLCKKIRFFQNIDPFSKYPIFSKATDLAQLAFIANNILNNQQPEQVSEVGGQFQGRLFHHHPQEILLNHSTLSGSVVSEASKKEEIISIKNKGDKMKSSKSSKVDFHNKVPKILTTFFEPDYDEPWIGSHIGNCRGSGFIIEHNGEKYVVTNAHCVSNHVSVEIELLHKNYDATVHTISYQADLALLKIKSKEFQKVAQGVTLGDMIKEGDKVSTVGYPVGGDCLSRTDGVVSRIESGYYAMGNDEMLQIQVDSAINPGNSGGPVFHKNRVVGVAFQGMIGDGLGYIIPVEFVKHFLTEAFSNQEYRGFPILPIKFDSDPLKNKYFRKEYNMRSHQTGILVNKVLDAQSGIKSQDVITAIDGHQIHADGRVILPDVGAVSWTHVCHRKFIGDDVRVTLLRINPETREVREHNIKVNLQYVPFEVNLIGAEERDTMPNFVINSGILYTPVTRNYLQGPGSELEEVVFVSENGSHTLLDAPKKFPDQQLVALNVLTSKYTKGYENYNAKIVSKVNDVEIRNFAHLIEVLESHTGKMHRIETSDKNLIIVKNLSSDKQQQILDRYHIPFDRPRHLDPDRDIKAVARSSRSSETESSNSEGSTQAKITRGKNPVQKNKGKARKSASKIATPGMMNFFKHIDDIEQQALHGRLGQDDNVIDFDKLSEFGDDEDYQEHSSSSEEIEFADNESQGAESSRQAHSFWAKSSSALNDEVRQSKRRRIVDAEDEPYAKVSRR